MGQSFDACIVFGLVLPEDYVYDHYENVESDSEWAGYEYADEALETHVERLCKGTNLGIKLVGYFGEEGTTRWVLCYKEPQIETGYGAGDYYTVPFDPRKLNVGDPSAHPEAGRIATVLGLNWLDASWQLCWSVS